MSNYYVSTHAGQVIAVADDWMDRYEAFEQQEAPALSLAETIALKIAPTYPDTPEQPMLFTYDEARALADAIGGRAYEQ